MAVYDDFEQQQLDLMQRRKTAREGQAFNAPQGQMVSGHYVAPHWTQMLAEGLRGYSDILGEKKATQDLKDLSQKRQDIETKDMGSFVNALRGTPARDAVTLPEGQEGPVMNAQPAVAGNQMDAYSLASASQIPSIRAMGQKGVVDYANTQAVQAQKQAETQRYMNIIGNAKTPQDAIRAGVPFETVKNYYEGKNLGRDEVKYEDIGGEKVPVTKYGDTPANVQSLTKTGNPFSDLLVKDANGNLVQNAPLVEARTRISKAGASNVDARTFNNQETEQSKVYGKTLGDIRGKITQAGFDAPKQLAKLDRMDALLQGVDGGAAAPTLAQISSMANTFGVKLDKNLGPKEAAIALAVQMATGMREPGTGAFTDSDFNNFLKTVPDLSKSAEGRKQIMTTMRAATNRDLEVAKFSRDYAKKNNGVVDDNFFDAVADFYAKNPVVNIPMPATNARGDLFKVVR
jgi:hypothetical protein